MNRTVVALEKVRAEWKAERARLDASIGDLDRVIVMLRAQDQKTGSAGANGGVPVAPTPKSNSKKRGPAIEEDHDRYPEMLIEALKDAGPEGMAPSKLRNELGIDLVKFRGVVGVLMAQEKVRRIGERGRGVKYALVRVDICSKGAVNEMAAFNGRSESGKAGSDSRARI